MTPDVCFLTVFRAYFPKLFCPPAPGRTPSSGRVLFFCHLRPRSNPNPVRNSPQTFLLACPSPTHHLPPESDPANRPRTAATRPHKKPGRPIAPQFAEVFEAPHFCPTSLTPTQYSQTARSPPLRPHQNHQHQHRQHISGFTQASPLGPPQYDDRLPHARSPASGTSAR